MKLVLAFDSFKNCLSSPEICRIVKAAFAEVHPDWEIVSMPLGDGGEGTAAAVTAALGGVLKTCVVHDPLHRKVEAAWGKLPGGGTAIADMASASGIELLKREELNPLVASTYGTGELLKELVTRQHVRRITIGIGGSASVDGGMGMLQALGVRFLDAEKREIPAPAGGAALAEIASIDLSGMTPEILAAKIEIASDVTNPLCGKTGAAAVFGPQKGATRAMVKTLDANLQHFGEIVVKEGIAGDFTHPGDGAAGGLGFALRAFLGAKSVSGAEKVLKLLNFDEALAGADYCLTGEGCSDFQTAHGKLCAIVARHAHVQHVPAILISGRLGERAEELKSLFLSMHQLTGDSVDINDAIAETPQNLRRMAHELAEILK